MVLLCLLSTRSEVTHAAQLQLQHLTSALFKERGLLQLARGSLLQLLAGIAGRRQLDEGEQVWVHGHCSRLLQADQEACQQQQAVFLRPRCHLVVVVGVAFLRDSVVLSDILLPLLGGFCVVRSFGLNQERSAWGERTVRTHPGGNVSILNS